MLGDSSATSNVTDGLVRGPRRASDGLDRCERTLGEQVALGLLKYLSGVYLMLQGLLMALQELR